MEKMSYGEKIRYLRKQKGWDQTQLGNLVGIIQAGISLLERGLRPLDSDMVSRLSKVFNVPEAYFFSNDREIEDKNSVTYTLLKQLVEQGIIDNPNEIDQETLDLIINVIKIDLRKIKEGIK